MANSVALHNDLVRERPDLAEEFYKPQPYDARGEQRRAARLVRVAGVHRWNGRLFVRLMAAISAPASATDAPRLPKKPSRRCGGSTTGGQEPDFR